MKQQMLQFAKPVTLVGGGVLTRPQLDVALAHAPHLVAADGAADRLVDMGVLPDAVIGDMDSIRNPDAWADRSAQFLHLTEQDTTDFEKCLYATDAPGYVGVGFTGRRVDHTLAVFHTMLARSDQPVVLVGEADAIALVPAAGLDVALEAGTRVSFFPLQPVRGIRSQGLQWSIRGLDMATGHQIGTSNIAQDDQIGVQFDGPGALLMVETRFAPSLIGAIWGSAQGR